MSALCVSLVPVYGITRSNTDGLAQRFTQSRKYEVLSITNLSTCSFTQGNRV